LRDLTYKIVEWPAKGEFRIPSSTLTSFTVIQVAISEGRFTGIAECRPYARYDETADSVIAQIEAIRHDIENGLSTEQLQTKMPAGAARNAVDCALWDLTAKTSQTPVWKLMGLPKPKERTTAFTLSLDTPEQMAIDAKAAKDYFLLKLKIGRQDGLASCQAVLDARPDAKLIIDANEAMNASDVKELADLEGASQIAMVEQPYPAGDNRKISTGYPFAVCADESLHTSDDLTVLKKARYSAVNVKLDKTGGLTEALKVMEKAKDLDFQIMAGCMVGSSLAMAPMMMLESFADFIDLDGPLLLSDDYSPSLKYKSGQICPPARELWG